eukprot:806235-Pleurochrysis_carterae.AAC.3
MSDAASAIGSARREVRGACRRRRGGGLSVSAVSSFSPRAAARTGRGRRGAGRAACRFPRWACRAPALWPKVNKLTRRRSQVAK